MLRVNVHKISEYVFIPFIHCTMSLVYSCLFFLYGVGQCLSKPHSLHLTKYVMVALNAMTAQ